MSMLILLALACAPEPTAADDLVPTAPPLTGEPGARLARLSHVQWKNTVVDLLHLDLAGGGDGLTDNFVDSATPSWFDNDRDALAIDSTLWLQYQSAAEGLATRVVEDAALLAAVVPTRDRDTFLVDFGLRAFRRPLTPAELESLRTLFDEGHAIFDGDDDFDDGVRAVLAAMLQSPHFLYRSLGYRGSGDGGDLEDYELASKLSYALWNTMPDAALLEAAASGLDEAELEAQVARMLDHPRGNAMVADLHRQWLGIDRYQHIWRSNAERYGDYEHSTPRAMTIEVYAFVDRIVFEGGTVQDLLSSRETQVESRLAAIYGIEGVEDNADNSLWVDVTLDPAERAGLFTLSGWLALQGDRHTEDLINRGAFLNHALLCQQVPSPGIAVPPLPVDETEQMTLRERIDAHTSTCGGACHTQFINPIGFAFSTYDGRGVYRTTHAGRTLDASGTYELADGPYSWNHTVELLEELSVTPQVHRCYLDHWLTYLEGHRVGYGDPRLDVLTARSLDGEPILELVRSVVTDPSFRQRP